MTSKILPVIMSGGSGTRLWPLSTPEAPKQFHRLATANTMIQETVLRLSGPNFLAPVVVCGTNHFELVRRQLAHLSQNPQLVLLEPMARNTAAVAALAAICGQELDPDALVLLVPADHVIAKPDAFADVISKATSTARERIVTLGIKPTHPETGFGYVAHGPVLSDGIFEIQAFLEKPDLPTASEYVLSGRHNWNAGIFLFSPCVMLEELARYAPGVLQHTRKAYEDGERNGVQFTLCAEHFAKVPSISIDYAVMEKTSRSAVIPCDIGWTDVGGFPELWRLGDKDHAGNHTQGVSIIIDSKNCLIQNFDGPPIAVVGMDDVIVISTPSGVLVCPMDRAQDIKKAAEAVKAFTSQ